MGEEVAALVFDPATAVVVDLGADTQRIHPDVITLDLFDYDEVDIVCSLDRRPFKAALVSSSSPHLESHSALQGNPPSDSVRADNALV